MRTEHAIDVSGVGKEFRLRSGGTVTALDDVTLGVARGTVTAVTGPVGSGKTTLLQLVAGLERADTGSIHVDGTEVTALRDTAMARFRRDRIGFVHQALNLLPDLTARDNILLPLRLDGHAVEETRLAELAERLGLDSRLGHHPGELSTGEQQLVAVARALLPRPEFILADEPTSSLDTDRAGELVDLLAALAGGVGATVLVATHDIQVLQRADQVHRLDAGRLADPAGTAVGASQ